ncbi:MAG: TIGR04438 family Trp-rich protein [Polaromonas sp.]|nr:TIGR04438 family Trp-rich protein [Polaromonas sp.]
MYFLLLGMLGLALKYFEIEPVSRLSWWLVMVPFGLAALWWVWADASGYTKRQEMKKMDDRRQKRLDKQRQSMGLPPKK